MATIEGTATGVSFALADEQKALRGLAREFAEKEIRPKEAACTTESGASSSATT